MLKDNYTALTSMIQRIKEEHDIAHQASYSSDNSQYWLGRYAVTKELLNFFDNLNRKRPGYDICRRCVLTDDKIIVK